MMPIGFGLQGSVGDFWGRTTVGAMAGTGARVTSTSSPGSVCHVRVHHLDQREQAARREAAHGLAVAQAAGGERVIAQAMPVFQQQQAGGIQAVQAQAPRVDQPGPLAACQTRAIAKQRPHLDDEAEILAVNGAGRTTSRPPHDIQAMLPAANVGRGMFLLTGGAMKLC